MIFIYVFFLAVAVMLLLESSDGFTFFAALFFCIVLIVAIGFEASRVEKEPKPLPKTGEINPFSLNNNANSLR